MVSKKTKTKKGKWGKRWKKTQRWIKTNINPEIYEGSSDKDYVIDVPEYDIDIRMPGNDLFGNPRRRHIKKRRK